MGVLSKKSGKYFIGFLLFLISFALTRNIWSSPLNDKKLVCYLTIDNPKKGGIYLDWVEVDSFLCTHIILGYASVFANHLNISEDNLQYVKEISKLKKINKNLKVMISVGGAFNDNGFSEMVRNHSNRKSFINSTIQFIESNNLDGVDLDWEFPNSEHEPQPKESTHFNQLLVEFHKELTKDFVQKLLSVAVPCVTTVASVSFDIPRMNDYVDFFNLMCYDFFMYTSSTPWTGHNSPLYSSNPNSYYFNQLNINYSANFWAENGINKSKIVIGLPTYGHSFKLTTSKNNGTFAPAIGYGSLGNEGFISNDEVVMFLNKSGTQTQFDEKSRSYYAYNHLDWISFENPASMVMKSSFASKNNFAGVMVYSLNSDNAGFNENDSFKFLLTNTVKKVLFGKEGIKYRN